MMITVLAALGLSTSFPAPAQEPAPSAQALAAYQERVVIAESIIGERATETLAGAPPSVSIMTDSSVTGLEVISFYKVRPSTNPADSLGAWTARRIRRRGDQIDTSFAGSDTCQGLSSSLSLLLDIEAPRPTGTPFEFEAPLADPVMSLGPERFTLRLWAKYESNGSIVKMEIEGDEWSAVGRWALTAKAALEPCWANSLS